MFVYYGTKTTYETKVMNQLFPLNVNQKKVKPWIWDLIQLSTCSLAVFHWLQW